MFVGSGTLAGPGDFKRAMIREYSMRVSGRDALEERGEPMQIQLLRDRVDALRALIAGRVHQRRKFVETARRARSVHAVRLSA